MKICPDCQRRYDDDVVSCPEDGEALVDLPKELSGNPLLQQPVAASPADRTSMIDLEAIEAKRAEKKKAAEPSPEEAGDEKTPPPQAPIEADPDGTGTLHRSRVSKRKKKKDPTQVAPEPVEDEIPEDRRVNDELTNQDPVSRKLSRTQTKAGTRTSMTRQTQMKAPPKKRMSAVQAAVLVMIGVTALIAGIIVVARATAVLTVTTVPPGASVTLDAIVLGMSPLQKRVRTGSHAVELSLDGYEPYKEVVDVPAGGLPFLQPLQKKPPPPPPPPTPAEIAAEMGRNAEMMFQAGDFEGSRTKVNDALKLAPCEACTALLTKIDDAIAARDGKKAHEEAVEAREARLQQARVLNTEGRELYEHGQLGPAKEKLYASLKLDATNPEPHRTLGRIFNREDEVEKVRYHLQRYLDLGGADGDFKVREWLKQHPK